MPNAQLTDRQDVTRGSALRLVGALIAGFSLLGGVIILFVIPSNNYASGLWLFPVSLLFLAGLILFLVGFILGRKNEKPAAAAGS